MNKDFKSIKELMKITKAAAAADKDEIFKTGFPVIDGHFSDVRAKKHKKFEKTNRSYSSVTGIETGFKDFDMYTGGLHNSDLVIVAARPAMGKTAFALDIAQYAAVYSKAPTAIFSLEMYAEQLSHRFLCNIAQVDVQNVRTGNLSMEECKKLIHGMEVVSDAPIYIDDTAGITAAELRTKCRKLKTEHSLGLVIVDYLQLMNGSSDRKKDLQQHDVAFNLRSLKEIARELDIPVIALYQLGRDADSRADHRPLLSDLRDSGAIEQYADMVCFIYRDGYYTRKHCENRNRAEVIIAKNRHGYTGSVNLEYNKDYFKYYDL